MNSREYWAKRAEMRIEAADKNAADTATEIARLYKDTLDDIHRQINNFYMRYADESGVDMAAAQKVLTSSESREWKRTLAEYVDMINNAESEDVRARLTAELDRLSYASRVTRLRALEAQVSAELSKLYAENSEVLESVLSGQYEQSYYDGSYDLQSHYGKYEQLAHLDTAKIKDVVSYPWSGAKFSDRLWKNREALSDKVMQTLTRGLIQGLSTPNMVKELTEKVDKDAGKSYYAAETLVRTEMSRIHGEATMAAYDAAGIEQYEFMASLSVLTCPVCGELDSKIFNVSEHEPGVNFPPMHPRCKCTTVSHDPLDESGSVKGMPYHEWYDMQNLEHNDDNYVANQRKKVYNKSSDRAQYERYYKVLGNDAPKTFDEFQNIKYGKPDEWLEMKSFYSYKIRVPEAIKTDFEVYNTVKNSGLYGTIRVPPVSVNLSTLSLDVTHIKERNHGVTVEEARAFIDEAIFSLERKHWTGETFINYYSQSGAAYVKTSEPLIRTAFKKEEFDNKIKSVMEELNNGK